MAPFNPVIPGFAPDPSITRIDDTFFLVTSSFHVFPGLPIYASKDLRSWKHIGNAINRLSTLSLHRSSALIRGLEDRKPDPDVATGGLYAPTIRHHEGRTYIVCTNVIHIPPFNDEGASTNLERGLYGEQWIVKLENFIVSSDDVWSGKWSDPVPFQFHGIDPDIFFDDDGHAYITGSSWKTNPSTIDCFQVDVTTGNKLSPLKTIWDGFSKIIPEGPHIYKRWGWYYLLDAEGGTHEGHRLAMARSRSIWGPYEQCPHNPILTPSCDHTSYEHVQFGGHGDLFQDARGKWWLVCLASRKDRDGRSSMGRETFLTSVSWDDKDSWPIITQPLTTAAPDNLPQQKPLGHNVDPKTGLVWARNADLAAYTISADARNFVIAPTENDLDVCNGRPVSFVGKRQRVLNGEATVTLRVGRRDEQAGGAAGAVKSARAMKAGLAYYKDEQRYARIYHDALTGTIWFQLQHSGHLPALFRAERVAQMGEADEVVRFRFSHSETHLGMYYSFDGGDDISWIHAGSFDLSDMTDHDFTGPCIGMFATRQDAEATVSSTMVEFEGFRITEDI